VVMTTFFSMQSDTSEVSDLRALRVRRAGLYGLQDEPYLRSLPKQMPRRDGMIETFGAGEGNKDPDAALVTAAKCGDARAFEHLVLRHEPKILALAQRITNNREDAEDSAQESFHKAFLHLDTFQEKSRFSTWLTRIALNEAYTALRRRRGDVEVRSGNSDDVKAVLKLFVDRNPNPEESCWLRERTELLTKAINGLGPRVGRTILLRFIEERSVEETAQVLNTSISAVKSSVFRCRRELRQSVTRALLFSSPARVRTATSNIGSQFIYCTSGLHRNAGCGNYRPQNKQCLQSHPEVCNRVWQMNSSLPSNHRTKEHEIQFLTAANVRSRNGD
jgi:RNA polymerase sigma-70 factor, ECF subfamily